MSRGAPLSRLLARLTLAGKAMAPLVRSLAAACGRKWGTPYLASVGVHAAVVAFLLGASAWRYVHVGSSYPTYEPSESEVVLIDDLEILNVRNDANARGTSPSGAPGDGAGRGGLATSAYLGAGNTKVGLRAGGGGARGPGYSPARQAGARAGRAAGGVGAPGVRVAFKETPEPPKARRPRRNLLDELAEAAGDDGDIIGDELAGLGSAGAAARPQPALVSERLATTLRLRTEDTYPRLPESLIRGISYKVLLEICVSTEGHVDRVTVKTGAHPELDRSLVATAESSWRYRPLVVAGRPVPFCHPIVVDCRRE